MTHKNYIIISGIIFTVVALLQLFRVLKGWEAVIGGFIVPLWASGIAFLVAGGLALSAFMLLRKP